MPAAASLAAVLGRCWHVAALHLRDWRLLVRLIPCFVLHARRGLCVQHLVQLAAQTGCLLFQRQHGRGLSLRVVGCTLLASICNTAFGSGNKGRKGGSLAGVGGGGLGNAIPMKQHPEGHQRDCTNYQIDLVAPGRIWEDLQS
jgi:hypothetical protein